MENEKKRRQAGRQVPAKVEAPIDPAKLFTQAASTAPREIQAQLDLLTHVNDNSGEGRLLRAIVRFDRLPPVHERTKGKKMKKNRK